MLSLSLFVHQQEWICFHQSADAQPQGSSSLSSSCAVSTGLKQRCQYGFVFNFCFYLTEEMFERIGLLQLVPVRYSRDIRACSYLQIAVFSNHCTRTCNCLKGDQAVTIQWYFAVTGYVGVVKIVSFFNPFFSQDQVFCIFEFAPIVPVSALPVPDPVASLYLL